MTNFIEVKGKGSAVFQEASNWRSASWLCHCKCTGNEIGRYDSAEDATIALERHEHTFC